MEKAARTKETYFKLRQTHTSSLFGIICTIRSGSAYIDLDENSWLYNRLMALEFMLSDKGPVYLVKKEGCRDYYARKFFFLTEKKITLEDLRQAEICTNDIQLFGLTGFDFYDIRQEIARWWYDNDHFV